MKEDCPNSDLLVAAAVVAAAAAVVVVDATACCPNIDPVGAAVNEVFGPLKSDPAGAAVASSGLPKSGTVGAEVVASG